MNRLLGGLWLAGVGCWLGAVACVPTTSEVGQEPGPDGGSMQPGGQGGESGDNGGSVMCTPGDKRLAADGCNTCTCQADFGWACTELACGCKEGDMRPAGDGCNTCSCLNGDWACTQKACEVPACKVGATKSDGCTSCVCQDFGKGAMWACTANECPQACKPGEMKKADDGCNTCSCTDEGSWACTEIGCNTCKDGDVRVADDGCNKCFCENNSWQCTLVECQPECKAGFAECDADPTNGCETDITTSVMNCGACGYYCAQAGATSACVNGKCEIAECMAGYADCNGDPSDGCEAVVGSGGCKDRCDLPADAPEPGPSTGDCDCPEGTTCVRHGSANPSGDYCVPLPTTCPGYGTCGCVAFCACEKGWEGSCTERMQSGERMIVDCSGTIP